MSGLLLVGGMAGLLALAEVRSRRQLELLQAPAASLHRILPDCFAVAALALLFCLPESQPERHSLADAPVLALAVDVSASMAATDEAPDRLGRAKAEMRALVAGLPKGRFALLPFAGETILQMPPTSDREALLYFIDRLTPGMVGAPGSAPEEAVATAQQVLRGESGKRAVILFSDGERTVPGGATPVASDIPVYIVPLGTAGGSPVTDATGQPRQDSDGRPVTTRLDLSNLHRLSTAAKGEVLAPGKHTHAITPLLARWGDMIEGPSAMLRAALLGGAILFLLARSPVFWGAPRTRGLALLLLCISLTFPACRSEGGGEGRKLFHAAAQLSDSSEVEKAAKTFAEAARLLEGEERAAALFNQGSLLLSLGRAQLAVTPLEQALLLLPGDEAIRRNLALALRASGGAPAPGTGEGEQESVSGEVTNMDRQQALQLLESVRPAPLAPPVSRADVRETAVTKDW